jgi:hypothetical protein
MLRVLREGGLRTQKSGMNKVVGKTQLTDVSLSLMSSYPERSSVIKQSNMKFVGREEYELKDSRQAVLPSNSVLFLALISWSRKVSSAAA